MGFNGDLYGIPSGWWFWATYPSEKSWREWKSVGMMTFHSQLNGKIKAMFQTTNQLINRCLPWKYSHRMANYNGHISTQQSTQGKVNFNPVYTVFLYIQLYMEVSWNRDTPKSSISRSDFPLYTIYFGDPQFMEPPIYLYILRILGRTIAIYPKHPGRYKPGTVGFSV